MTYKELLNLDLREEEALATEAKKRELRRELSMIQAVRFGVHATKASYEERVTQITFELRKYEEEY